MAEPEDLVPRLLDVIERDILPLTRVRVAHGNHVCGAAILHKNDLSLVLADTNNELSNPLWHGEVQAINQFYARDPSVRPSASDCLFLATHEPCPLCLSAIACAGFDNFFYLFDHAEHQVRSVVRRPTGILKEVFGLSAVRYHDQNAFWNSYSLKQTVSSMAGTRQRELASRIEQLQQSYRELVEAGPQTRASRSAAARPAAKVAS